MAKKILISVVIVDFFKAERIVSNVERILAQQGDFNTEVIIIDNSMDSGNQQILSQCKQSDNVTLFFNKQNNGYTRGCNQGADLCRGDYLLFVNPDIEWTSVNILADILAIYKRDPRVGIVGTRQMNDDGSTPDTVRRFPNLAAQVLRRSSFRHLPLLKGIAEYYEYGEFDYFKPANVDWLQSSFMAISRHLWDKIGGFDCRYFIFMADPDICYKCWEQGYKVHYESEIVVGADGLRCSAGGFKDVFSNRVLRFHIRDAFIYHFQYLLKPNIPTARKSQNQRSSSVNYEQ
ncbi:glycosyltransferase [Moritella marina ATCC 15381]|uniref:Glycosyltransferase n=1 Tax=Moritella marina ATCC 15381 TaxID=1202962 RepID=A0A5J6WMH7_MORMI|nr:glycosyltransferase [Moritella marina]QFI37995.1 glycosyltransferase [Moritella marina ATCC 15381]